MKRFSILLLLFSIFTFAQKSLPAEAKPSSENKVLIDELIKVTDYENFFKQYCLKKIRRVSNEEKWTEEYKKDVIESIKFKYYIDSIYNSFAFTSKNDLQKIVESYKQINQNAKNHKFIISNEMMINNLELFTDSLIKGKYIVK